MPQVPSMNPKDAPRTFKRSIVDQMTNRVTPRTPRRGASKAQNYNLCFWFHILTLSGLPLGHYKSQVIIKKDVWFLIGPRIDIDVEPTSTSTSTSASLSTSMSFWYFDARSVARYIGRTAIETINTHPQRLMTWKRHLVHRVPRTVIRQAQGFATGENRYKASVSGLCDDVL